MRFEYLLSAHVYCVVTMLTVLETKKVFVVVLTTMLFSVSKPCSVLYTCRCNGLYLKDGEGNCESLLGGHRDYINCFDTCIIPNQAFKDLPCQKCLDTLSLDYNNISDIQPDAFADLNELSVLSLSNNEIQELRQSTFQNIPKLMTLHISFNRIRYVHPETFVYTKSLYDLNISHNDLVLKGTILYSEYINILDASYCNPEKDASWNVLKYPVFSGLPNLTKLVLEGNSIQCVMWDTFSNNRRLKNVDLKNNMLKAMPHQLTLCSHVVELDLTNNPIQCNCHIRMFSASCSGVKLDEISCGTPSGLEDVYCDNVSPTEPPDTGTCDFYIGSTQAVTSALPTSEDITQDYAKSDVFSATSETVISYLYPDQHTPTSAHNTPKENERLVESSGTPTAETEITLGQTPDDAFTKVLLVKSYMWFVIGAVVLLVVIIVIVSVVVVIKVCRRQDIEDWEPDTLHITTEFGNRNQHTYDKVADNNRRRDINMHSFQKLVPQEPDPHYSCLDVNMLYDVSTQTQPESRSCSSSVSLETDGTTASGIGDSQEHVYEEIN